MREAARNPDIPGLVPEAPASGRMVTRRGGPARAAPAPAIAGTVAGSAGSGIGRRSWTGVETQDPDGATSSSSAQATGAAGPASSSFAATLLEREGSLDVRATPDGGRGVL